MKKNSNSNILQVHVRALALLICLSVGQTALGGHCSKGVALRQETEAWEQLVAVWRSRLQAVDQAVVESMKQKLKVESDQQIKEAQETFWNYEVRRHELFRQGPPPSVSRLSAALQGEYRKLRELMPNVSPAYLTLLMTTGESHPISLEVAVYRQQPKKHHGLGVLLAQREEILHNLSSLVEP